MIVGEGTATVSVAPREVVEFVLDLKRYREADRKIGRVGPIHRDGDTGTVQFSGRIKGLPGPSGVYPFTVTDSHLQFGSPVGGVARWFLDFEGTFTMQETADGTVSHIERRSSSSDHGDGSPSLCFDVGWKPIPPRK